jgi:transcriptional regulator with XRE-family HTH domain
MSTETASNPDAQSGHGALTPLGLRLEILRLERGLSKQRLAQRARTSRQQLWRVMTGKSELTGSLRDRLAEALAVDPAAFATNDSPRAGGSIAPAHLSASVQLAALTVTDYLTDAEHVMATLRTLPSGDGGRRLKRALLNALEDLAVDAGGALPVDYTEIRRRVLAGEL